jgi:hypothetical protein
MMFNFNQSKKFLAIVGCGAVGLLSFSSAYATNPEPVTAEVEFVAPITITETNALQYGSLDVAMAAGETITIAPDGTQSGTGLARIVGSVPAASALTVTATGARGITILVGAIANGTYYGLTGFTCDYAGGADLACDGAGMSTTSVASTTLRVGATLTGAGGAVAGNDDGGFNVTVSYQ